jgi:phage baseplate assembly protein W
MNTDIKIHPLDLNPDVSIGVVLPLRGGKSKAFEVSYLTIEQAKSNIRSLLLTNEGERVMQPLFGCNLRKLVFEPLTPALVTKMRKIIEEKTKYWLPYIVIDNINVNVEEDLNYINFELQFSLAENTFDKETVTFNITLP